MSLGFRTVLFSPLVPDGVGPERVASGIAYRWRAVRQWDAGDESGGMETQWSPSLVINGTAVTRDLPVTPAGNGLDVEITVRSGTPSGKPEVRIETVAVPTGTGTIDFYNTNPGDGEVLVRLNRSTLTAFPAPPSDAVQAQLDALRSDLDAALAGSLPGGTATVDTLGQLTEPGKTALKVTGVDLPAKQLAFRTSIDAASSTAVAAAQSTATAAGSAAAAAQSSATAAGSAAASAASTASSASSTASAAASTAGAASSAAAAASAAAAGVLLELDKRKIVHRAVAGVYPGRPVTAAGVEVEWQGPVRPAGGGTVTSGTGAVAGLDSWVDRP